MTTTPNLALTQYATTDKINWVNEYNKDMLNIDTAVKANQTSLDATNSQVALKANQSDLDGFELQLAQKASEVNLAIERERINLIQANPGSTSGDLALNDIKIGADGKTYSSPGDAVRGQVGELQNIPYAALKKNYFYANFDSIKDVSQTLTMNSYGNGVFYIIPNENAGVYKNGVMLTAGTYIAFAEIEITSYTLDEGVSVHKLKTSIVDGWAKRYDAQTYRAYNGETTVKFFDTINFTNDNNLKCTLAIVADCGFAPNSTFVFKIKKMGLLKVSDGVKQEIVEYYSMQKKYPAIDFPATYINTLIEKQNILDRLGILESAQDVDLSIFDQAYIKNKELIANSITPTNNNVAQYTVAEMPANVKTIKCKVKFYNGASAAIITEPNGMYSVLDVTKKSIHIVFSFNGVSIGYFNNGVLTNRERVQYSIVEGTEYIVGFTVNESTNTIIIHLPTGEDYSFVDANYIAANGKFALWEHYINIDTKPFTCVKYTKFWVEDINGKILCDNFKRLNGAIGIAPTGQVYGQFSNKNQTGWSI